MTAFPAFCPSCESIFPFLGIKVAEGTVVKIEMDGNKTDCPVCGKVAQVSDGIFQANSTAVHVLSGPDSTRHAVQALQQIAEKAASGHLTTTEAIAEAIILAPKYGMLIDAFAKLGLPGLALLVTIISISLQIDASSSSTHDANRIVEAINQQTLVLKNNHYESIENHRANPPAKKADKQSATRHNPSSRRTEVNRQRRAELRKFREAYGKSRTH